MKRLIIASCACLSLIALPGNVDAEVIGGVNWADDVADYSSNIQNFNGSIMDDSTEYWVLGPPDADANDNGHAWDGGDPDFVGGWRSNAPGEYITVYFDLGLADGSGNDLSIRLYSGSGAECSVLASIDGADYEEIGAIDGGTTGYLRNETFDFDGAFAEGVHYVKVLRVANGPQTGMFFDAFGGQPVPEPGTILLLSAAGLIGLLACVRRRRR